MFNFVSVNLLNISKQAGHKSKKIRQFKVLVLSIQSAFSIENYWFALICYQLTIKKSTNWSKKNCFSSLCSRLFYAYGTVFNPIYFYWKIYLLSTYLRHKYCNYVYVHEEFANTVDVIEEYGWVMLNYKYKYKNYHKSLIVKEPSYLIVHNTKGIFPNSTEVPTLCNVSTNPRM